VYAGCVYWPFEWGQNVGLIVGGVIVVAGVIEAVVSMRRQHA